jgi:CRISPR-associated protein Csb2
VQSEFDDLIVLRVKGRSALPARYSLAYASAVRDTLLAKADELGLSLSPIHGHDDAPHCAFAALPSTGHPHSEGTIKAFAIVFPKSVDGDCRAGLRRAAARIRELRFGQYGDCTVSAASDEPVIRTADPTTWVGPSLTWTSVTPILYDRFPKDRPGQTAPEIISASCTRIGLPTPASIVFGKYSPFPGVPPVEEFKLQRKRDERPHMAHHITLEFPQPIRGPILLGAGRYFGLGLCRPIGRGRL